jgi:hypothetical protein
MAHDDPTSGVTARLWRRLRGVRRWTRYIVVAGVTFLASLLFIVAVRPVLAPVVGRDSYGFVVLAWMLATLYVIHLYSRDVLAD